MSGTPTTVRVLHVDDDPDLGELVAVSLEREDDRFDVLTAAGPDDGMSLLETERVDCVVSDYDMPGETGIEFLERVRESYPDLPFILYTGKGSEAVASDAISAGVTDYLQKGTGTDQYALLANRIDNAVSATRSRNALEERNRRLNTLISNLPGVVYRCRNEPGWPMEFVAGECAELTGYTVNELESGQVVWGEDIIHPDDRERMWEAVQAALDADEPFEVTYPITTADDEVRWVWERGRAIDEEQTHVDGFITDVTGHRERERALELLHEEIDSEHLDAIERSQDRTATLIDDLLALGR
jgi:PAS domain S-box-containing protein